MAMARLRESSAGSFGSCSAVTGDDAGEPQHNWVPVVVSGASNAPSVYRGGGGGAGAGRFGIYQGNWGDRRRAAELPEVIN